jgi:hypothetical protein
MSHGALRKKGPRIELPPLPAYSIEREPLKKVRDLKTQTHKHPVPNDVGRASVFAVTIDPGVSTTYRPVSAPVPVIVIAGAR